MVCRREMWAAIWRNHWKSPIPAGTAKDTHGFCPVPGLESLALCQREAGEGAGWGARESNRAQFFLLENDNVQGRSAKLSVPLQSCSVLHRLPSSGVWSHPGGMNPCAPCVICCDSTNASKRVALPLWKIGMVGGPSPGDHETCSSSPLSSLGACHRFTPTEWGWTHLWPWLCSPGQWSCPWRFG